MEGLCLCCLEVAGLWWQYVAILAAMSHLFPYLLGGDCAVVIFYEGSTGGCQ